MMVATLVGLGDSVAFGIGDNGDNFSGPGWLGRSAYALGAGRHLNLAFPGARSKELARVQIPAAECMRPDLALISIGGNDMLRSNFNAQFIARDIQESVNRLLEIGTKIFLIELPDPTRSTLCPSILAGALRRRAVAINTVLRQLALKDGVTLINIWSDDQVYQREFWHVDRLHPSPLGYQYLTDRTVELLGARPRAGRLPVTAELPNRWRWLLANASMWILKRSFDLIPSLALAVAKSALSRQPQPTGEVAPPSGLEPETLRLTVECSAN